MHFVVLRRDEDNFIRRFTTIFAVVCMAVSYWPPVAVVEAARAAPPSRVVSMVPSITETVFALGAGPSLVAVSDQCDYPPRLSGLARVGTFVRPVTEAIVALRPDLVLTSPTPGNLSSVRALERSGIRVEVVHGDGGIAEARAAIVRIAQLLGREAEGRRILDKIDSELAASVAAVRGRGRPRTALLVGHDPLILAGPDSYLGEILSIAGGLNLVADLGGRWPRVGLEFFVAEAPEVIIDISMGSEAGTVHGGGPWSRFPSLPAVASGRVVELDGRRSMLLRPGPRLGEAALTLAHIMHPDAFDREDD